MNNSTICDEEGVPKLVQSIKYVPSKNVFSALFFNGYTKDFLTYSFVHDMWAVFGEIDDHTYAWAASCIEELAQENWGHWFPSEVKKDRPGYLTLVVNNGKRKMK